MIDTNELRKLCTSATPGPWYISAPSEQAVWYDIKDRRYLIADTSNGFTDDGNAEFIAAANPATVLALLDELEKQKSRADILEETVNRLQRYVTLSPTLDKDRVKRLLTVGDNWVFCLRHYLEDANLEIDKLTDEVVKLRTIRAAARNLVKVKGRHHSEQAYQKLVEVLG